MRPARAVLALTTITVVGLVVMTSTSGCQLVVGNDESGAVAWRHPLSGTTGWSGLGAATAERFYFQHIGAIVALNAQTGAVEWTGRFKTTTGDAAPNLLVSAQRVLAAEARAAALSAGTGGVDWRTDLDTVATGAQSDVDDRALYVATYHPRVVALAIGTGAVLWSTPLGTSWEFGGRMKGVRVAGDTVYAAGKRYHNPSGGLSSGFIAALHRNDGRLLWLFEAAGTSNDINSAPAVAGRFLVASDLVGNSFFAIDRFTMVELWRVRGAPNRFGPHATPVIKGDTVFVASNDEHIYAVSLQTGAVHWKTFGGGALYGFAVCGDVVIANGMGIVAVDRRNGRIAWRAYDGDEFPTSEVATNGTMAFVTGARAAYAFHCRR